MIEATLKYLGKALSEVFEVELKNIIYEDKDAVLRRLSEENVGINFPAITFFPSDISNITFRPASADINLSFTNNIAKRYNFYLVKMTISCAIFCSDILSHTKMTSKYFKLLLYSELTVNAKLDGEAVTFESAISELQPLTSPPSMGREGFDFDKGKYYVKEGGFSVSCFVPVLKFEQPLIRHVSSSDNSSGVDVDLQLNILNNK